MEGINDHSVNKLTPTYACVSANLRDVKPDSTQLHKSLAVVDIDCLAGKPISSDIRISVLCECTYLRTDRSGSDWQRSSHVIVHLRF